MTETPDETPTEQAGSGRERTSVTSRARRIGGGAPATGRPRPTPGPRTSPQARSEDELVAARTGVSLTKSPSGSDQAETRAARRRRPRPAAAAPVPPPAQAASESEAYDGAGRGLLAIAAVFLAIVLLVADLAVLSHRTLGQKWLWVFGTSSAASRSESQDGLLAAAKDEVAVVISYDYRHLDQDRGNAVAVTTGQYQTDYTTTMDKIIKPQAPAQKAVVAGQVGKAGIQSVTADGTQAQVLVYAQQTVSNVTLSQPRQDVLSLVVTMTKVHGKWLISAMRQA